MLAGRQAEIHAARDRKLETARQQRRLRRLGSGTKITASGETEAALQGCNHAEG